MSQFITKIEYISGPENVVADALSRVDAIIFPSEITLAEFAETQNSCPELKNFLENKNTSLNFKKIMFGKENDFIFCDLSSEVLRLFVPASLRDRVFQLLHSPAHPGAKVTDRIIRKRYVWPNMHKVFLVYVKIVLIVSVQKYPGMLVSFHHMLSLPNLVFLHSHGHRRSSSCRFRFQVLLDNDRPVFAMARGNTYVKY